MMRIKDWQKTIYVVSFCMFHKKRWTLCQKKRIYI
jgi:hypothetical protein